MSNDLISRSALISHIESQYRQWGEDYDAEQILGDIEDFATAYDVEKVVRKIKERSIRKSKAINTDDAIKIVKEDGMCLM